MSNLRLRAIFLLLLLSSPFGPTFRTQIKDKGALFSLMGTWNHNDTGNGTRNATSNGIESADSDYLKIAKDNTSTVQFNYLSAPQDLSGITVLRVDEFEKTYQAIDPAQRAHIKGFGEGMTIDRHCAHKALELLKPFKLVIWDGDDLDKSGFTALLPMFLANPASRVVAFKAADEIADFVASYKTLAKARPGRLAVVAVDVKNEKDRLAQRLPDKIMQSVENLPDWGQTYFFLGRYALVTSGAKYVFALGGGGVAALEAEACAQVEHKEGGHVKWVVFALSRGRKEDYFSLIDWATAPPTPNNMDLLTGYDRDDEALARSELPRKKWMPDTK